MGEDREDVWRPGGLKLRFRYLASLALLLGSVLAMPSRAQTASTGSRQAASTGVGQSYPAKPIRLIVGFIAGGGTDRVSRVLSRKLSDSLGQQVIVDNRAGSAGLVGAVSAQRMSILGEVPTIAEAGVPGYEATSWQGVVAPAGTPRAIVNRLYEEIVMALRTPEVVEWLAAEGSTPGGIAPAAFAAHI